MDFFAKIMKMNIKCSRSETTGPQYWIAVILAVAIRV